ncbi:hypothetical protein GCM10009771_15870 [Nesterenkonia flava]
MKGTRRIDERGSSFRAHLTLRQKEAVAHAEGGGLRPGATPQGSKQSPRPEREPGK